MGGFHKSLGKVYKPIRKVVDPLNIMDPMRILPGSTAGFTKKGAFSLDPNYGGPLRKLFGGGGGTSNYSMPRSSMDMSSMFAGQNQMLANMQAQNSANAARQQASLNQLRSSSPLFPTMPAPETPAQISQTTPAISAPTTIAQSKINGTTSVASDLPVEFVYKPATATSQNVAANTFTLPDMSNIKFGGT